MSILAPSFFPTTEASSSLVSVSSQESSNYLTENAASTTPTSADVSPKEKLRETVEGLEGHERTLKIPSMRLSYSCISDDMAACLAVSLLGHVLFLKNQVPFPVVQLSRIPGSANQRAAKRRAEMVDAFDELSSHLHTTFPALSDALAHNKTRYPSLQLDGAPNVPGSPQTSSVYLAFLVGPTPGAPKARVMLALEGLEVKMSNIRYDDQETGEALSSGESDDESEILSDEAESSEGEEDGLESKDSDSEPEDIPAKSGRPSNSAIFIPPSPSISAPSYSQASIPSSTPPKSVILPRASLAPKTIPHNSSTRPHKGPAPRRSRAEEQQTLRSAERLLSRTLADAAAENGGINAELSATQTHVMLRAPRRFSHPAWAPRQNLTSSLNVALTELLADSGLVPTDQLQRPRKSGVRTEGVHVGCATVPPADHLESGDEQDDMIWWLWTGKLTGFSEW